MANLFGAGDAAGRDPGPWRCERAKDFAEVATVHVVSVPTGKVAATVKVDLRLGTGEDVDWLARGLVERLTERAAGSR